MGAEEWKKQEEGAPIIVINGRHLKGYEVKDVIEEMLLNIDMKYAPLNAIKENLEKVCELFIEYVDLYKPFLQGKDKGAYTRMQSKVEKSLMWWKRMLDKAISGEPKQRGEQAARFATSFFDFVLALEGTGTLAEFGVTDRFGDSLKGNPEKVLISTVDSIYGT